MSKYFITPSYCVGINFKAGSSYLSRRIIKNFYPDIDNDIVCGGYPLIDDGKNGWHFLCPSTDTPDKPVILMIRNPIDRFVSALDTLQINKSQVNSILEVLEHGRSWPNQPHNRPLIEDVHFKPQHHLIYDNSTSIFRFPDNIYEVSTIIGMAKDIPIINMANNKILLTQAQKIRIRKLYQIDWNIFESI